VQDEHLPPNFMAALERMAALHGQEALSPEQITVAVELAKHVAAAAADLLHYRAVYLPDSDGVLAHATALHYNDADWLGGDGLRLIHPDIPLDLAETLGVVSLRLHHQVS
jgi:hypothetical protein